VGACASFDPPFREESLQTVSPAPSAGPSMPRSGGASAAATAEAQVGTTADEVLSPPPKRVRRGGAAVQRLREEQGAGIMALDDWWLPEFAADSEGVSLDGTAAVTPAVVDVKAPAGPAAGVSSSGRKRMSSRDVEVATLVGKERAQATQTAAVLQAKSIEHMAEQMCQGQSVAAIVFASSDLSIQERREKLEEKKMEHELRLHELRFKAEAEARAEANQAAAAQAAVNNQAAAKTSKTRIHAKNSIK
jgi:hypothetical protein